MSCSFLTDFQRRVLERVCDIPSGRVTTYNDLARAVGIRSPRAIGQALKSNPNAPKVPCHRVICSDLTLGGYQGQRGGGAVRKKRLLLAAEGVAFDDQLRLVGGAEKIFRFSLHQHPEPR